MGKEMLEQLCQIIIKNIKEEFAIKHLSLNLVNTIQINELSDGVQIYIPAQVYDMLEYKRTKVIKYISTDSYASTIDEMSKNHTGYVNRVVDRSVEEWLLISGYKMKAEVEDR